MPRKSTKKTTTKSPKESNLFSQTIKRVENISVRNKAIFLLSIGVLALVAFMIYKYAFIAWVNGTPITRFKLNKVLETKYGKDLREQLISETLIMNEARKRGVSADPNEVEAQIKKIEDQQGGPEKLDQILVLQGLNREELKDQIKYQVLIEKMFGDSATSTPEEVNTFISENIEQFPNYEDNDSSESAKVKMDVTENLRRQKIGKTFNDWLKVALESKQIIRL